MNIGVGHSNLLGAPFNANVRINIIDISYKFSYFLYLSNNFDKLEINLGPSWDQDWFGIEILAIRLSVGGNLRYTQGTLKS